jgi:hypothetical protein
MLRRIILVALTTFVFLSLASTGAPEKIESQSQLGSVKDLISPASAGKEVQLISPGSRITQTPSKAETYFLLGNIKDARGTIDTDRGTQQTSFSGEIALSLVLDEKGGQTLNLMRLNLLSPGVATANGQSGTIGLNLEEDSTKTNFERKSGQISSQFRSKLHYALIDKIKGFIPGGGKEEDVYYSYIETMSGQLDARLPQDLKLAEGSTASLDGEIVLTLDDPVIGALQNMRIIISIRDLWISITEPAEILNVQPVFIGTGRSDPTATGTVYPTLIRMAADIWNRCGTERCLTIRSNDPIYINDDGYRVIEGGRDAIIIGTSEAYDLMDEVDVLDAVEVFIVERWDPFYDGGGATWSSGTASSKIVTCDQQLDVPCPPPSELWGCSGGFCGDVNYYHLAHELGHVLNLCHPDPGEPCRSGMSRGTANSILEPSGFCRDNPDVQSARNCRLASSPLLYWGRSGCTGVPNIND